MVIGHGSCRLVRLYLQSGSIVCRYYEAALARSAVVWLGGVGGGFDSPANDLFDRLAVELLDRKVASIRLRYRYANDLDSSVEDALVALEFLGQRGVDTAITVGFAFGGAVSIKAGATSPLTAGVVGLASQSAGTSGANRISPRPLLLIHGDRDTVLPLECSELIYRRALEPKELVILQGAGHCFEEAEPRLHDLLVEWITGHLGVS
ncbi:MAG: alpha/beta hydrolase [Chloroflexota bacterium]